MRGYTLNAALMRFILASLGAISWLLIFYEFLSVSRSIPLAIGSISACFALSYIAYVFTTPLAAIRMRKGVSPVVLNGTLLYSAAFTCAAALLTGLISTVSGALLFSILIGLARAFYYIPYDVAHTPLLRADRYLLAWALLPALVGAAVTYSSVLTVYLFVCAATLALLAALALIPTRSTAEGFSLGYYASFQELQGTQHKRAVLTSFYSDLELICSALLWQIGVLYLSNWNFATYGIVTSASLIIAILVRRTGLLAYICDSAHARAASIAGAAWLLRLMIAAPLSVVAVDALYGSGTRATQRGISLVESDAAPDARVYIDETSALKRMGVGIGVACAGTGIAALSSHVSFGGIMVAALILGALSSIMAEYSAAHEA